MANLLDLSELSKLQEYPLFIRVTFVLGVAFIVVSLVMAAIIGKSPKNLQLIAALNAADGAGKSGFQIMVRNDSDVERLISAARIEMFQDLKPSAGLQSSDVETFVYTVVDVEGGQIRVIDDRRFALSVEASRPFFGNSYTVMTIPINRLVKSSETIRIFIAFRSKNFWGQNNTAEISIVEAGVTAKLSVEVKRSI